METTNPYLTPSQVEAFNNPLPCAAFEFLRLQHSYNSDCYRIVLNGHKLYALYLHKIKSSYRFYSVYSEFSFMDKKRRFKTQKECRDYMALHTESILKLSQKFCEYKKYETLPG